MNNVKLLHYKVLFFPIFQKSSGIEKKFGPQEKVEMTPLHGRDIWAWHVWISTLPQFFHFFFKMSHPRLNRIEILQKKKQ